MVHIGGEYISHEGNTVSFTFENREDSDHSGHPQRRLILLPTPPPLALVWILRNTCIANNGPFAEAQTDLKSLRLFSRDRADTFSGGGDAILTKIPFSTEQLLNFRAKW